MENCGGEWCMTWEECLNIRSVQNSQEICVQLSIHPVLPGFTQYEGLGCDLDICVFINSTGVLLNPQLRACGLEGRSFSNQNS